MEISNNNNNDNPKVKELIEEIKMGKVDRIKLLLEKHDKHIDKVFSDFVDGLRKNLNNSITDEDAIEMLAQHMITKPVFEALFEGYDFVKNNPVSKTMQKMLEILDKYSLDVENQTLEKFYNSVRDRVKDIDNIEGKQKIILELYEKFFKVALPKEVEKLGIVYTPKECVDFMLHSVEALLKQEFNLSMSDKNVHIIDGFTGIGTFIVRLLQSGIIKKEDLLYKYTNEIHANEIVLLAYYIAAINIEETFHDIMGNETYVPFDGIVLTDTFQLYEDWNYTNGVSAVIDNMLPKNSERTRKQKELPITIVIGNPPYSVGQKSGNDDAQNLHYPKLESKIQETYAKNVEIKSINSLYDSYIKAFRWASDMIKDKGIIAFITNGGYIDNRAMCGFRRCLLEEFTSVYVYNLRGNARTSGEQRRRERDNVFGQGTRTPVAITFLIKNPSKDNDNFIHYCDIGDYLTRAEKLNKVREAHDILKIEWKHIKPDYNNDWINKQSQNFTQYIPLSTKSDLNNTNKSYFSANTLGVATDRDAWVYNFSMNNLKENILKSINYYTELLNSNRPLDITKLDKKSIHWTREMSRFLKNNKAMIYNDKAIQIGMYRPFLKKYLYYDRCLVTNIRAFENIITEILGHTDSEKVPMICITGVGTNKDFSCFISNNIVDYQTMSNCQVFPLYWFKEENKDTLTSKKGDKVKLDGISDYIYEKTNKQYKHNVTKEAIFYYVYGFLHSPEYKDEFSTDLKKSLPRIPLVESYDDFKAFSNAGRQLAELHLGYESIEPYNKCQVQMYKENYVVSKMKFGKNKDKRVIVYNDNIIISNIPLKAYEYVVNGKSAIEWIMEYYQIKTDKESGIINNPNDWCKEVGDEKYILNLLLRVINVSLQTVDIVKALPKLNFD